MAKLQTIIGGQNKPLQTPVIRYLISRTLTLWWPEKGPKHALNLNYLL